MPESYDKKIMLEYTTYNERRVEKTFIECLGGPMNAGDRVNVYLGRVHSNSVPLDSLLAEIEPIAVFGAHLDDGPKLFKVDADDEVYTPHLPESAFRLPLRFGGLMFLPEHAPEVIQKLQELGYKFEKYNGE